MLVIFGLTCLATASTFEYTFAKVDVDNFVAEVGALFLVVGSLQFLFEMRLRRELLSEVASAVIGSERVVASGLIDWLEDSRKVSDEEHWRRSKKTDRWDSVFAEVLGRLPCGCEGALYGRA